MRADGASAMRRAANGVPLLARMGVIAAFRCGMPWASGAPGREGARLYALRLAAVQDWFYAHRRPRPRSLGNAQVATEHLLAWHGRAHWPASPPLACALLTLPANPWSMEMGVRGPTLDGVTGIITTFIAPSAWYSLELSSWLAALMLGRRRKSATALAAALLVFFIVPLAITDTSVDCDFTLLFVGAACDAPPLGPGGPPSAKVLLPRVVSYPEAPRVARVLITGSLEDVVLMASGRASTLGLGRPPPAANVTLRVRAAGTAAHDIGMVPRAVGARLPTCVHIEEFIVTCSFTASAQASSQRRRGARRTRRRMQRATGLGQRGREEAPGA